MANVISKHRSRNNHCPLEIQELFLSISFPFPQFPKGHPALGLREAGAWTGLFQLQPWCSDATPFHSDCVDSAMNTELRHQTQSCLQQVPPCPLPSDMNSVFLFPHLPLDYWQCMRQHRDASEKIKLWNAVETEKSRCGWAEKELLLVLLPRASVSQSSALLLHQQQSQQTLKLRFPKIEKLVLTILKSSVQSSRCLSQENKCSASENVQRSDNAVLHVAVRTKLHQIHRQITKCGVLT